jgi:hypothetical protein
MSYFGRRYFGSSSSGVIRETPATSSFWPELQQTTDAIVDEFFGESIEFHPYTTTDSDYEDTAVPDVSRSIVVTTGILVTPGAAITGEGGTQGSGSNVRVVTNAAWISITDDKFDETMFHKGDRVYFPERLQWNEIAYDPPPSATHRPNIPLLVIEGTDIPTNP